MKWWIKTGQNNATKMNSALEIIKIKGQKSHEQLLNMKNEQCKNILL